MIPLSTKDSCGIFSSLGCSSSRSSISTRSTVLFGSSAACLAASREISAVFNSSALTRLGNKIALHKRLTANLFFKTPPPYIRINFYSKSNSKFPFKQKNKSQKFLTLTKIYWLPSVLIIVMAAGKSSTTKIAGKIKNTIGKLF